MKKFSDKHRIIITSLMAYLLAVSTAIRHFTIERPGFDQLVGICLYSAFFLLMTAKSWLPNLAGKIIHLYLAIQCALITALFFVKPYGDFYALLFLILGLQTSLTFSLKATYIWIAIYIGCAAVPLLILHPLSMGIPLLLLYAVSYILIGSFTTFIYQAEEARAESKKLFGELEETHKQLKAYAGRAEEVAVIKYRHNLARNLHDSVTQTIFSLSLTTESARILLEKDPSRVAGQLTTIQQLAKSALGEMRSLILELKSNSLLESGFIPTLEDHFAKLKQLHNLEVDFVHRGSLNLTGEQELQIFRIIQEALNNVIKHARVNTARVMLDCNDKCCTLSIQDRGIGFKLPPGGAAEFAFSPENEADTRTFGLNGMHERTGNMGGRIVIESEPGKGTLIRVETPISTPEKEIFHG